MCSRYCNNYKVAEVGREKAISLFREHHRGDKVLYGSLWTLSGRRLVCHCKTTQSCHGDVLIEEFVKSYPSAHNRNDLASEPWITLQGCERSPSRRAIRAQMKVCQGNVLDIAGTETLCSWARWLHYQGILRRAVARLARKMGSRVEEVSHESCLAGNRFSLSSVRGDLRYRVFVGVAGARKGEGVALRDEEQFRS